MIKQYVEDRIGALASELTGKTLTRPALHHAGLFNSAGERVLAYAVDVAIEQQDEPLVSVPIVSWDENLYHTAVGSAVRLERNGRTGRFQVVGFAAEMPGSWIELPVNLDTGATSAQNNRTLSSRPARQVPWRIGARWRCPCSRRSWRRLHQIDGG